MAGMSELIEEESTGSPAEDLRDVILEVAPQTCHPPYDVTTLDALDAAAVVSVLGMELLMSLLSISLSYHPWKVIWLMLPLLAAGCQMEAVKPGASCQEEHQSLWALAAALVLMLQIFLMSCLEGQVLLPAGCFLLLNFGLWSKAASFPQELPRSPLEEVSVVAPEEVSPEIPNTLVEMELEEMCSICLRPLGVEPLRRLHCGHAFHQGCIDPWLRSVRRGETRLCPMRCENPQVPRAPLQRNRLAAVGGA